MIISSAISSIVLFVSLRDWLYQTFSDSSEKIEGQQNGQESSNDEYNNQNQAEINTNSKYVGLENLGSTCYMNSLLQALSGCSHYLKFSEFIVKNKIIRLGKQENGESYNDILYNFILILLQLNEHDQDVDTSHLFDLITNDTRLFQIYEQSDAHELNLYIQDKLITHIPASTRKSMLMSEAMSVLDDDPVKQPNGQLIISTLSQSQLNSIKQGQNPMLAQVYITMECPDCSRCSCPPMNKTESQLDINLDLPQGTFNPENSTVNLLTLVNQNFKPTIIEGFKCIKCSIRNYLMKYALIESEQALMTQQNIEWNLQNWTEEKAEEMRQALDFFVHMYKKPNLDEDKFIEQVKRFKLTTGNTINHRLETCRVSIKHQRRIIKPPKILCFHFNRLAYDRNGNVFINRTKVDFDEILILDNSQVLSYGIGARYRLASLIEHHGSIHGGHFIAAKRINNPIELEHEGKFLICNDKQTSLITVRQAMNRNPFMVFYEQF